LANKRVAMYMLFFYLSPSYSLLR